MRVGGVTQGEVSGCANFVVSGWRTVSNKKRTSSAPPRPDGLVGRGSVGQRVRRVENRETQDVFAAGALLNTRDDGTQRRNERAKISPRHFPDFLPLTQTPKHPPRLSL